MNDITETSYSFGYKWTRVSTGHYYYGVHKGTINDGYVGSGTKFNEIFRSTPIEDWRWEIVAISDDYDTILKWESEVVTEDTLKDELCLNLIAGGQSGTLGLKHSDEARIKISTAHKGKTVSAETRAKVSAARKGSTVSDEARAKMSTAHTGKILSAETRAKMSAAKTGENHPQFGTLPWETPRANKPHIQEIWKRLPEVYIWWLQNNKKKQGSGYIAAAAHFGCQYSTAMRGIINYCRKFPNGTLFKHDDFHAFCKHYQIDNDTMQTL